MRTCLITGGSGGIGGVTAALLRERGWNTLTPTREEWAAGQHTEDDLLDYLAGVVPDAIVFCHGEWFSSAIQDVAVWEGQYASRVMGPALALRALLPRMSGGCVVTVASTRGLIGGVDTGPYSCACAAQIALMLGYAREWPGVRFNVVAPGLTATRMGQEVIRTGGAKPGAVAQPPEVVAAEIVRLVESPTDNGRVMRVADGLVSEAKWTW